jgi:hypothetical protein
MRSSSWRFADYAAARNRAPLHVRADGKWVARYVRDPDAQSPAGGASSSARDLAQWLRLLLASGKLDGKQIIATAALDETHRPQIVSHPLATPTDRAGFYGLGWNVNYDEAGRVRLNHSGGFDLGAATVITLVPSEDLGILVLTNGAPIGAPEALSASFLDLVLQGKVQRDWAELFRQAFAELAKPPYGTTTDYAKPPARKSPALPAEAYVGTYRNDYFGDLDVVEKDGALLLRLGPKKNSFALRHWDRDGFLYQPAGESAAGLSAVTFRVGPDRQANQVTVEDLNIHGQGTFTQVPAGK